MTGEVKNRVLIPLAFNVAAGQSTTVKVTAPAVRVLEASGAFGLSIEGGREVTLERGLGVAFRAPFEEVTIIAPAGNSVDGVLLFTDGLVQDNRVTISAEAGLVVNVSESYGAPVEVASNTLTVSGGATPSRAIIAALDTSIEWVVVQNRGASVLALSNAEDETDAALLLEPGEKSPVLPAGGVLWITNTSASVAGAYAVMQGERA